jgi:hypothetical protein
MLLGIAGLAAENGYTRSEEVRIQTKRLAQRMKEHRRKSPDSGPEI